MTDGMFSRLSWQQLGLSWGLYIITQSLNTAQCEDNLGGRGGATCQWFGCCVGWLVGSRCIWQLVSVYRFASLSFKQVLIILAGSPEIVSQTRYGRKQKDTMEPNQELEHALFFSGAFVSSFNNTEDSRRCDNQSSKTKNSAPGHMFY